MPRKRGRIGDYIVEWDDVSRKFFIKPKSPAGGENTTPKFSLGNADLILNIGSLSGNNKVVKVLTGETNAKKLLPVPSLHLPRWEVSIRSVYRRDEKVTGINGTNVRVNWMEANGFLMDVYENSVKLSAGGDAYCYWRMTDIPSVAGVSDKKAIAASQAAALPRDSTFYAENSFLGVINNGIAELWTMGQGGGGDRLSYRKSVSAHPSDRNSYPVEVTAFKMNHIGSCSAPYGNGLRIRFSNGDVYTYGEVLEEFDPDVFKGCSNAARITMRKVYKPTGMFYKSGIGDAGVVPFLSDENGNDFIITVFEEMEGDTIVIMRENGIFVIFPSGLEYHLDGTKTLVKAFKMRSWSFVLLADGSETVLYRVKPHNNLERIAACDYAGSIVTWPAGNGAPPIGGFPEDIPAKGCGAEHYQWIFNTSPWSGAGQTGHVVGDNGSGWWHLYTKKSPGYDPDFYSLYYVVDGKIHVLTYRDDKFTEMSVTRLSQIEGLQRKQNGERQNPEINFLPGDVRMVVPGAMDLSSVTYLGDPRKKYTKDTVSNLYFG